MPASCGASAGLSDAEPPCAASTCSHSPSAAQMSAISSSGSNAPVAVVPALATTAIGRCPRARRGDLGRQGIGAHAEALVARDRDRAGLAEAHDLGGARRGVVRLVARQQRERRAAVRAVAPDVETRLGLARGEQRRQRRDGAAVHDHAAGGRRQTEPAGEVPRERRLARAARLAQLVDRARAVDHRDHERPERRQRQRSGQLVPDVRGMVRDRALGEDLLDEGERIGAAAEVGRPALGHARRVERMRDGGSSARRGRRGTRRGGR